MNKRHLIEDLLCLIYFTPSHIMDNFIRIGKTTFNLFKVTGIMKRNSYMYWTYPYVVEIRHQEWTKELTIDPKKIYSVSAGTVYRYKFKNSQVAQSVVDNMTTMCTILKEHHNEE